MCMYVCMDAFMYALVICCMHVLYCSVLFCTVLYVMFSMP